MSNSENSIRSLIKEFRESPLAPLELPRIIKQLSDPNTSILDFKPYYYRDPVLSSYLIEAAWKHAKNKDNAPIAVDHAMSTLGMTGAEKLFFNLQQKLKAHEKPVAVSEEVKFLMSASILAAELVNKLLANSAKAKQLYWPTMTYNFAETLLWHLKPKPMWRIQYRQLVLPKKLPLFEQAKLGFDLREWRMAVAKEWHMSHLVHLTYEKQPPFGRKDLLQYIHHGYSSKTQTLKQWHLTDSWLILTANWLAKATLASWLSNGYQHYFKITQRAFNVSYKKLGLSLEDAIRASSEQLKGSQLFVPAVRHFELKSKAVYPEWLNAKPKIPLKRHAKFAKQSYELKQKADLIAVEKFTHEIRNKPKRYRNTNVLLRQILELTTDKLNFSRASLLIVDWKNKKVSTAMYSSQKEQNKIKLSFDFSQKTPLKKFLVESLFVVFDKRKHENIWSRLPTEIHEQNIDRFVFFSFKPKEKVEFLIYIDALGKSDISIEKLKATKQLLLTANKVIIYNTSKS